MDFDFDYELGLRLMLSLAIGTLIGIEREYRSKAAGLRTMIIICLGSTIFTQISTLIGGTSHDRIASTIVTGIGFLGAGVIFKDGFSVSGLTTATTIWICAALGMAVGAGQYFISLVGSVIVLFVLTLLEKVQRIIEKMHQERAYKITFLECGNYNELIENEVSKLALKFRKKRELKEENKSVLHYEVSGSEKKLDELNIFLKNNKAIKSYEY
jgi:putative Mg2+ transporter-C (MgtC) family protein